MRYYGKCFKHTICGYMKKTVSKLALNNLKKNKGRPRKLSEKMRKSIVQETNILSRELRDFCVKTVKSHAVILPLLCDKIIQSLPIKNDVVKWRHPQYKRRRNCCRAAPHKY